MLLIHFFRRKQYVSQLEKWGLRKYGLQHDTKVASYGLASGAGRSNGSKVEGNRLLNSLQRHQPTCTWCQRASYICLAIQQNVRFATNDGPLSEKEVLQKLDLADFYLGAKAVDIAWTVYAEVLYRSQSCWGPERLLVALKILCSSIHFKQWTTAKAHLAYVFLTEKGDSEPAAKPLWMTHLLRGMLYQTQGEHNLAALSVRTAVKSTKMTGNNFYESQILRAQRELIAEMVGILGQTFLHQPWIQLSYMYPKPTMESLLHWCMKKVIGDDYCAMLSSAHDKPWTRAPSLRSFEDFEGTALFCYLWQKYTEAKKVRYSADSPSGSTILRHVEYLERSLHIPTHMIFSAVSWMRADVETVSLATYAGCSPEQMARQAVASLQTFAALNSGSAYYPCGYKDTSAEFHRAYTSLGSHMCVIDEESQFREVVRSFVRQFAQVQVHESITNQSLDRPEAYRWAATRVTCIACLADEEKVETSKTGLGKGRSVNSANQQTTLTKQPAISTSPPHAPTVQPTPGSLPTIRETSERPASSASVDMLNTPRSSLSSSKASLRSFQRFGRGVAELLLKRGDNGANQLPSEVMGRDSHSSWSLRRLTGVSYLSATSEMTENGETEQDTVMEDAPHEI